MSLFSDVGDFHEKFGLHFVVNEEGDIRWDKTPAPIEVPKELMEFRIKFLDEELDEFKKGVLEGDIAQQADALVDLVYVALGTAHLMGIPFNHLWEDVQRANLSKERAAADGSNSKRGSSFDVIKPEGWVGPETGRIIKLYGFKVIDDVLDDPDRHTTTEGMTQ